MGMLVEGKWVDRWYDTKSTGGRFVRDEASFRDRVTRDGSSGFPAEPGRYHLYVSLACPWAHRTILYRRLKDLENAISISIVDPIMAEDGWQFSNGPGCIPDPNLGARYLREVYVAAAPRYTGRATVPVLWDKKRGTIVSNESAEIIRMLNSEFDEIGDPRIDFSPAELLPEIDAMNARVYASVNNGVYRCGFATTQEAYEEAFYELFGALNEIDDRLARHRWLVADNLTEADWRLFTTLIRFDAVYFGHFKCNLRRIVDYRHLSAYLRELYQIPGVADTVDFGHIQRHYYGSHRSINPNGIVPIGPELDLLSPPGRDHLR